jgi:hypothetical protein
VGLFGRRKPLHEQLAEAGGLVGTTASRGAAAEPPGWDGEPRGEPGIHGVPRARRWDVVTAADVAGLKGDALRFVVLPDGSLLAEDGEPDEPLAELAAAVEEHLAPPYRAEAVRRGPERWAIGASRIDVASIPSLQGDEAELVASADGHQLQVDGRQAFGTVPELRRLGERVGGEFVVRAHRLDGDLWEVEASPL